MIWSGRLSTTPPDKCTWPSMLTRGAPEMYQKQRILLLDVLQSSCLATQVNDEKLAQQDCRMRLLEVRRRLRGYEVPCTSDENHNKNDTKKRTKE